METDEAGTLATAQSRSPQVEPYIVMAVFIGYAALHAGK
jgi:hypothetical protein